MGDRAGFDDGGDPIRDLLDARQCGRQLVVVAGVLRMYRHRPLEDRRTGRKIVGYRRTHQSVAGQVLVGVDEPWCDHRVCVAEDLGVGKPCPQDVCLLDRDDRRPIDCDCAVANDFAARVHREDIVPDHQQHSARVRSRTKG